MAMRLMKKPGALLGALGVVLLLGGPASAQEYDSDARGRPGTMQDYRRPGTMPDERRPGAMYQVPKPGTMPPVPQPGTMDPLDSGRYDRPRGERDERDHRGDGSVDAR
jgi:hypothetical protein